jgi:hypothetical protein
MFSYTIITGERGMRSDAQIVWAGKYKNEIVVMD